MPEPKRPPQTYAKIHSNNRCDSKVRCYELHENRQSLSPLHEENAAMRNKLSPMEAPVHIIKYCFPPRPFRLLQRN